MKTFVVSAAVASSLLLSSAPAQSPDATTPAEIMPVPSASPTAAPAANSSPTPVPSPTPAARQPDGKPPSPTRAVVDSLSDADVLEMIGVLKSTYLDASALSETELGRATVQGLIDRLAPGATILPKPRPDELPSLPFRTEFINERTGYLRLGTLTKENVAELDKALKTIGERALKSAILDLRATPPTSDFELAAEVIKRFCAKGEELFSITKGRSKQDRIFTSNREPAFRGILVVLADNKTSGAPEVIAAVLRQNAKALVIGENTTGQAVEFADVTLASGKVLRVAVAEAVLPRKAEIYPKGVKPDITVPMPDELKRELVRLNGEQGVAQLVAETERPRMNEAALVAGINPEMDAVQAAQRNRGEKAKPVLRDVQLQRALDLITTIGIYERK